MCGTLGKIGRVNLNQLDELIFLGCSHMYICLKGCIESIATLMLYNSQPWDLEGIASW